jgi:hypothetical protein
LHRDLPPEEIAKKLGGDMVWKQEYQGQWVALIRFERVLAAQAEQHEPPQLDTKIRTWCANYPLVGN